MYVAAPSAAITFANESLGLNVHLTKTCLAFDSTALGEYAQWTLGTNLLLPAAMAERPIGRPIQRLAAKQINEPVPAPAPVETTASYKSSRLLIASVAVPEAVTIIVNVDNEPFYSRNATAVGNFPLEDKSGKIQLQSLQSLPSIPLSEERPLPPGKHKVQVNVMMASRRVGKVQEITEKFQSGQRRILEIDFLPENQSSHGRDPSLFKITLK